jgi:hypothetical protein
MKKTKEIKNEIEKREIQLGGIWNQPIPRQIAHYNSLILNLENSIKSLIKNSKDNLHYIDSFFKKIEDYKKEIDKLKEKEKKQ